MMFKRIKVVFIYDGIADKPVDGALFGDRVLVCPDGDYGLYDANYDKSSDTYTVNLNENDRDYLANNPSLLLDYLAA